MRRTEQRGHKAGTARADWTVEADAAKQVPLKTTLRFENATDHARWLATADVIAAGYPGETFADKLTAWVDEQMTKLSGQGAGEGDAVSD